MVLPEGTTVPPLPHLLVLAVGLAVLAGQLRRDRPRVSEAVVVAFAPWMVVGSSLHVLYQLGAAPDAVAPFLGSPAVYATTALAAGAVWLLSRRISPQPLRVLAGIGVTLLVVTVSATLAVGGVRRLVVPIIALLAGVVLGLVAWYVLRGRRPTETATTGRVGLLVVLAHAIDGVSTAAGVDVLGFGERTPASRAIMDLAGALPTAELIGVGWLFVLVKLVVATAVVALFAEYVREAPSRGYALLGVIAAVGLGPGAHNLLLFAVAGG